MLRSDLDSMVAAYVEAMLWAGLDWSAVEGGADNPVPLDENYGPEDVAPEALRAIEGECRDFFDANESDLEEIDPERAGHDFYLTRNGHGAGFWDRGWGALGDRLAAAARVYGESGEYVGDDGLIHI